MWSQWGMGAEPGDYGNSEPIKVIGKLAQLGTIDTRIDQDQPAFATHHDGIGPDPLTLLHPDAVGHFGQHGSACMVISLQSGSFAAQLQLLMLRPRYAAPIIDHGMRKYGYQHHPVPCSAVRHEHALGWTVCPRSRALTTPESRHAGLDIARRALADAGPSRTSASSPTRSPGGGGRGWARTSDLSCVFFNGGTRLS
jgi:hypothetical protein